jgi:chlorophyll/bacteriochlorophyll a synthase
MTSPRQLAPECQLNVTSASVNWSVWLELLKPITWFPPMWAVACGVVAAGAPMTRVWPRALMAIVLAGPLVCGASQAVNDWFDRDVDAINEPHRPIPSGRVPGRQALWFAIAWSTLALLVAAALGPTLLAAVIIAVALAWAYSAPPLRLKRNGWLGNAAVGISYEGLAWIVGASVIAGHGIPPASSLALAALYSAGTVGIMTLNDFKSIEGDRRMGIRSLPASLGEHRAAAVTCAAILGTQVLAIAVMLGLHRPGFAIALLVLLGVQIAMMRPFLDRPRARALWYSAAGVPFFVAGMMVSASALRGGP